MTWPEDPPRLRCCAGESSASNTSPRPAPRPCLGQFLRLARPDVAGGRGLFQLLHALAHHLAARCPGQFGQFVERVPHIKGGARFQFHADEKNSFGALILGGRVKCFQIVAKP